MVVVAVHGPRPVKVVFRVRSCLAASLLYQVAIRNTVYSLLEELSPSIETLLNSMRSKYENGANRRRWSMIAVGDGGSQKRGVGMA